MHVAQRFELQPGSPLTEWIRKNSGPVHERYLRHLERTAKVPYDVSVGKSVEGLRPKVHRLMSPRHDPILGFIFGVIDLMRATGTLSDKNGEVRRVGTTLRKASMRPSSRSSCTCSPTRSGRLHRRFFEGSSRLELYRQGLDEDLVTLRTANAG